MADSFAGVTVTFDKTEYSQGETMTLTLSGSATGSPSTVTDQPSVTAQASDGSTAPIQPASATINVPGGPLATIMSAVADSTGRIWTIAANGLTATATA